VSIGYVGTKGTALFETVDGNPVVPGSNPRAVDQRVEWSRSVQLHFVDLHSLQTS